MLATHFLSIIRKKKKGKKIKKKKVIWPFWYAKGFKRRPLNKYQIQKPIPSEGLTFSIVELDILMENILKFNGSLAMLHLT